MFEAFKRLFGRRDKVSRLAHGTDRRAFVDAFVSSDVVVMAALHGDGIDPSQFTQEQILAEIERSARDLAEDRQREPFVYVRDGVRRLPVFTSMENAQRFGGEYCRQRNRMFAFQTLQVSGDTVRGLIPACDVVVLNDACADEYVLSEADIELLRSAAG